MRSFGAFFGIDCVKNNMRRVATASEFWIKEKAANWATMGEKIKAMEASKKMSDDSHACRTREGNSGEHESIPKYDEAEYAKHTLLDVVTVPNPSQVLRRKRALIRVIQSQLRVSATSYL